MTLLLTLALLAADFPLTKLKPLTWVVDYEPFWSPDGKEIVLISSRHGGMKVHVLPAKSANGSDMRQLTTGNDEDDSPAWSPDGKRIAFVRIHAGVSRIFVMDADGSHLRQVAEGESIHPTWSPDGARILFNTTWFVGAAKSKEQDRIIGDKIDEKMDLATVRPAGSDLRRLTIGGGHTYASYSPDGQWIVHRRAQSDSSKIFVMKADGRATATCRARPAWTAGRPGRTTAGESSSRAGCASAFSSSSWTATAETCGSSPTRSASTPMRGGRPMARPSSAAGGSAT